MSTNTETANDPLLWEPFATPALSSFDVASLRLLMGDKRDEIRSRVDELKRMVREAQAARGCFCVGVEPQTYEAAVELWTPPHMARDDGRGICVDACIAREVQDLWREGITTTGSCCGHGAHPAFIGVIDADIPRMKAMGYEVAPNPCRPGDEDSFWPKSISCPST